MKLRYQRVNGFSDLSEMGILMSELAKWLLEYYERTKHMLPLEYRMLKDAVEQECINGYSKTPIIKEPTVIKIPSMELKDFSECGEDFWHVHMNNQLVICHNLPHMTCVIIREFGKSYFCWCQKYLYDDRKNIITNTDVDGGQNGK